MLVAVAAIGLRWGNTGGLQTIAAAGLQIQVETSAEWSATVLEAAAAQAALAKVRDFDPTVTNLRITGSWQVAGAC